MSSLTEFLLARIGDTIADAREIQALAVSRGLQPDDLREPGLRLARRALAECEAKRRIVERHRNCDDVSFGDDSTCPELRDLAAVYADHLDYREEWKP